MNIGIDLGGTKIQVGIEKDGEILHQTKGLLKEKDSLSSTLDQVIRYIKPYMEYKVEGIGIGVPSVVDIEKGIVYNVTNIPSWKKVALKEILEKEFSLPVFVNNDVNCLAIGEHTLGVGKPFSSLVAMSIGTGLGSGIIIRNKLYAGVNCGAGEIGLLPYKDKNIEFYASGNFFSSFYDTTALDAYKAAKQGNQEALRQWKEFGHHLGVSVQAVLYTYDPQAIISADQLPRPMSFLRIAWKPAFLNSSILNPSKN